MAEQFDFKFHLLHSKGRAAGLRAKRGWYGKIEHTHPELAGVFFNHGEAFVRAGHPCEAAPVFERGLEICSNNHYIRSALCAVYRKLDRVADAEALEHIGQIKGANIAADAAASGA